MITADESTTAATRCSIDSLMQFLHELEREFNRYLVNMHTQVTCRNQDQTIQCVSGEQFKLLVEIGSIDDDTMVLDNTIQTIQVLHNHQREMPMKESWHRQALGQLV